MNLLNIKENANPPDDSFLKSVSNYGETSGTQWNGHNLVHRYLEDRLGNNTFTITGYISLYKILKSPEKRSDALKLIKDNAQILQNFLISLPITIFSEEDQETIIELKNEYLEILFVILQMDEEGLLTYEQDIPERLEWIKGRILGTENIYYEQDNF
ncbi:MAG: hypothetical protein ABI721_00670 [Candidatus Dojkabacteria bacterium]